MSNPDDVLAVVYLAQSQADPPKTRKQARADKDKQIMNDLKEAFSSEVNRDK